ncbi:MAG: CinA family nicotinamide mononucleotide deamidase-related protein [Planctomycetes bacterium]|nr:CinA family nicotinamide mononucleotide deamidase-related protein [Planctomycetota bacterium]
MRARVLLSGDELVEGRLADTNGALIARALTTRGFEVVAFDVVGDDLDRLTRCLDAALDEVEATVVSGGLGGTADDLTRPALAAALGVDLVLVPEARADVEAFWRRLGRPIPPEIPIEAILPRGTAKVTNPVGLAPGVLAERRGHRLLCLPGVPSELRGMIEGGALDLLGRPATLRRERLVRLAGLAESRVAIMLGDRLERGRNPLYGIAAKSGEVQLAIRAVDVDAERAEAMLDAEEEALRQLFGASLHSADGRALEEVVVACLLARGETLAIAESLTGGLVGEMITALPGVSAVLRGGVVAYANEVKTALLGVDAAILDDRARGAVSEDCALAMARGARRALGADWAIATTGIAGPTGGSAEKPVGLVWVAAAGPEGAVAERRIHPGDRLDVRRRAAMHALDLLRRQLG